jgi:putative oxidoreductase
MRIVVGFLFLCHGAQKLFGVLGGDRVALASVYGVAGVIELAAGLLVVIGLLTRWAAFVASGQMAVAYFTVHLPQGFWPIQNGGELAAMYAFVFLFIATHGDGIWAAGARRTATRA